MPKDSISEKIRLGDLASNRDPRRASWGYYASDENVCGVGLFSGSTHGKSYWNSYRNTKGSIVSATSRNFS
jgi:hypothetical protein